MGTLFAGARHVAILVGGSILLLAGVAFLVLPGPGIPLIFAGLAVLGTRMPWARRTHHWMRDRVHSLLLRLRNRRRDAEAPPSARP